MFSGGRSGPFPAVTRSGSWKHWKRFGKTSGRLHNNSISCHRPFSFNLPWPSGVSSFSTWAARGSHRLIDLPGIGPSGATLPGAQGQRVQSGHSHPLPSDRTPIRPDHRRRGAFRSCANMGPIRRNRGLSHPSETIGADRDRWGRIGIEADQGEPLTLSTGTRNRARLHS